jgi:hypothetical protein
MPKWLKLDLVVKAVYYRDVAQYKYKEAIEEVNKEVLSSLRHKLNS